MSNPSDRVFDSGLQAERTALAWRRTALAMAAGSVGVGRLAAPVLGVVALVVAAVGLVQAGLVAVASHRRYRVIHETLIGRGDLGSVRHGGAPMAALACSGVLVGVLALVFVVTR